LASRGSIPARPPPSPRLEPPPVLVPFVVAPVFVPPTPAMIYLTPSGPRWRVDGLKKHRVVRQGARHAPAHLVEAAEWGGPRRGMARGRRRSSSRTSGELPEQLAGGTGVAGLERSKRRNCALPQETYSTYSLTLGPARVGVIWRSVAVGGPRNLAITPAVLAFSGLCRSAFESRCPDHLLRCRPARGSGKGRSRMRSRLRGR